MSFVFVSFLLLSLFICFILIFERFISNLFLIYFCFSATALAKLAHPEGEVVLTRAAYSQGVIQMLPTLASCSLDVCPFVFIYIYI